MIAEGISAVLLLLLLLCWFFFLLGFVAVDTVVVSRFAALTYHLIFVPNGNSNHVDAGPFIAFGFGQTEYCTVLYLRG